MSNTGLFFAMMFGAAGLLGGLVYFGGGGAGPTGLASAVLGYLGGTALGTFGPPAIEDAMDAITTMILGVIAYLIPVIVIVGLILKWWTGG